MPPVFRRRRPGAPDEVQRAFHRVLGHVERAKGILVAAVPSGRTEGIPVAEAVLGFERALREAWDLMAGWRTPETETVWRGCRDALARSTRGAERLRLEAPAMDHEALVTILGDLIAPLEAFEAADGALAG